MLRDLGNVFPGGGGSGWWKVLVYPAPEIASIGWPGAAPPGSKPSPGGQRLARGAAPDPFPLGHAAAAACSPPPGAQVSAAVPFPCWSEQINHTSPTAGPLMRRLVTLAAAVLVTLGAGAVEARANHGGASQIIDGWYHRFLGRCADQTALCYWVPQLGAKGPDCALAHL